MIEIDRIHDCDTQVLWPLKEPCLGMNPWSVEACLRNVWHTLLHVLLAARLTQHRETLEEEEEETEEKEKEQADERKSRTMEDR